MEEFKPPTTKMLFQSDKRYHVFLSFRGEDVRKTLVDHLFEALSTAGLNVFLDSEKLEKGEIIGLGLEAAIKSSAIRIPIFSKGYANSAWCLKEAAAMVNSPGLIIPLFYDVEPTHVRYPEKDTSPYKRSFLKHYGLLDRYPREEIDEWKHALQQICSCSGWSMDITEGFEARLVKRVVNDVTKTFDRVPLEVAKHPVGLESVTEDIIQKLNLNSVEGVVKVGMWGIGGIGKTTIAKAVYNIVYGDFNAASFLFNVRATAADGSGLTKLQRKILKDVTKYGEEVDSVDEGKSLLRDRLGGKRLLLILDDVDDVVQLNALVGDWLAPGSRVIITSRDRHILNVARVSSECIHEMGGLEINEGLQLFSWHTFLRASPSPGYEDLSKRIVEACKGHPLSLEVIGSFLYDKQNDTGCWTEALHNITLNPHIHKTLYISYSALSAEEKEIFLDIACFFIREDKTCPLIFWKSQYKMVDTAISNLSMKLLIKIDDKGVFDMHDHLRDMGRTIAEKEGTRLWEAAHLRSISNNTNFSRLRLNGDNPQRLEMLYRPGLRYLHLQKLHIENTIEDMIGMLPPGLIWLRLESCYFATGMKRTKKKPHGAGFVDSIWQLKIILLDYGCCFDGLSTFSLLGNLSQLQHLDFSGCHMLNDLPDTIGNLSQVEHMDLSVCKKLNKLPDTIGSLSQLQHLNLSDCQKLNSLPDSIGNLSQLHFLNLNFCYRLNNLPPAIGNLSQLQHLGLRKCESLNNLPDTIGNLLELKHLDLGGCANLDNLPDSIGNLSQLQHLDLSGCRKLDLIPNTIGNQSQLQYLNLNFCYNLNNLPDAIGKLARLQHLDLFGCQKLNNLPDHIGKLSQLRHLGLRDCVRLNKLPDTIGNLLQLQHLDLGGCESLNNLPATIGNLSQLQHLDLGKCINLNNLPDSIGNLSQLQLLDLSFCYVLNKLPDTIGSLSQLHHLDLSVCQKLNNLPNTIGNLSHLQHLDLGKCINLINLPETIGNLSQLQNLDLSGCKKLNNLPINVGDLSNLQFLRLYECENLKNISDTIGSGHGCILRD
ncbi:disease resistance protein RPV1 [Cryptomeria japonica]|uniref:disease resistance protein RPV1 n=1 Tax=Cryptomeria japonica TaxID=3369 RepID=UPI0027DA42E5|nr:disease resistance protein RPV1 [Cryptomeria japonica]XP_057844292.2 disease resistance protein RPV1 [Cryptomeria japonica]XP_059068144.1 disease resistance protein RPV1 [Cryptomeria japonica]XP_059068145.1 disease resistance protein RPV1 [Cryptomeria japonica]XP_059068146.1 disease resistance protein RPV1 [Cryptomeria japonica]XP_059068147.1 disease resistance protein RPV1 [Cryptomeria japonica]XP_059068148.1 disease resistance protein RPV1 [Cryptomeria japonica]XP_059068149.1 disease re